MIPGSCEQCQGGLAHTRGLAASWGFKRDKFMGGGSGLQAAREEKRHLRGASGRWHRA